MLDEIAVDETRLFDAFVMVRDGFYNESMRDLVKKYNELCVEEMGSIGKNCLSWKLYTPTPDIELSKTDRVKLGSNVTRNHGWTRTTINEVIAVLNGDPDDPEIQEKKSKFHPFYLARVAKQLGMKKPDAGEKQTARPDSLSGRVKSIARDYSGPQMIEGLSNDNFIRSIVSRINAELGTTLSVSTVSRGDELIVVLHNREKYIESILGGLRAGASFDKSLELAKQLFQ